jgi:DNA-directed RNA polymerase specialized sigma24 family protein
MGARPPPDPVDPVIAALIRRKARKMTRATRDDEEDLEQELWLNVTRAMKRHDPRRGHPRAHAATVINNRANDIVSQSRAAKRDVRRQRPFDDAAGMDVIDPHLHEAATDLAIDLRAEFESSSAELRAIKTLFELHSEAEIVRITGLTRQRVRGLKARLADQIRRAGLVPEEESSHEQPSRRGIPYMKGIGKRGSGRAR